MGPVLLQEETGVPGENPRARFNDLQMAKSRPKN